MLRGRLRQHAPSLAKAREKNSSSESSVYFQHRLDSRQTVAGYGRVRRRAPRRLVFETAVHRRRIPEAGAVRAAIFDIRIHTRFSCETA